MNYANKFQKLLHFVCNLWGKSFSIIGITMNVFPHLALFHFPVWRDFTSSFGERHVSVDMKSTDFLVSICQCPFLLSFPCRSSTIFCTICLVRTIYCIVFVIVLYNIGFCFLCFLFRNIISVTYTLALIISVPFPIHSRSVSDPLSGLS